MNKFKEISLLITVFGVVAYFFSHAFEPGVTVSPAKLTEESKVTKHEAPDYAKEATFEIEGFLSWDVAKAHCAPVEDGREWYVACKGESGLPYIVYSVSPAQNKAEAFHLVAINGKAKQAAFSGKQMRALHIDTNQWRNDVDIERVISKIPE
ncbi:hypothetical protein [Cronobacter dublinensis]|uniref:hypothetical protein n=1 Tax=Cronobacter dublinensis TaxID=413497 RepID=UPI00300E4BBF